MLLFRAKSRVNEIRCTSKFDHLAKLKYTVGKLFVLYFSNFKSQLLLVPVFIFPAARKEACRGAGQAYAISNEYRSSSFESVP